MGYNLFDTHADTPYEMYKRGFALRDNPLHISLDKTARLHKYCQCMAIWSDSALTDSEAFTSFKKIYEQFKAKTEADGGGKICRSYDDIITAHAEDKAAFVMTVEDARLLCGDISRLDVLADYGIKMLTMTWQGESCIGGAFDTNARLTEFGRAVACGCARKKIITDISHSNVNTALEIIDIASESDAPVIATHSNSYAVYAHDRNMTDEVFSRLVGCGGIVGISLAVQHISDKPDITCEDVFRHIDYYAEREGIEYICLGCDYDGIETAPRDLQNISMIENLAECMLRHNYTEDNVRAVFSENARLYMKKHLK